MKWHIWVPRVRRLKNMLAKRYIQHNPLVGDGPEPFIAYFEKMANEYPEKSIEFVRSVA